MPKDGHFSIIPDKWVQEWGLSPTERIVLADFVRWSCTISQHAERCRVAEKTVRNALAGLSEKAVKFTELADLLKAVKITAENGKIYRNKAVKITAENGKIYRSPHTPLYTSTQVQTSTQEHLAESAPAREEPENFSDKNHPAAEPAPTPQPPAPAAPDSVLVKRVSEWEQEHRALIAQGSEWANSLYRLYKITNLQLNDYLTLFTDHCTAQGEEYKTLSDYRKHLTSWLRYRVTNNNYGKSATTPQQRREVTRSTEPAGADF
jgi:hypothetical protein